MYDYKGGQDGKSLLLATWGMPWKWKQALYVSATGKNESERVKASSVTEYLLQSLKPDRCVLLILDTLASGFLNKELKSGSYLDVKRLVRDKILNYVSEQGLSNLQEYAEESKLVLEILPAVGRYNGWQFGRFKPRDRGHGRLGTMAGFYSESLHIVLRELVKTGANRLVIDITYGINYATVLLHKAAEAATDIYLASSHAPDRITIDVYNSEPYPTDKGVEQGIPELRVHKVYTDVHTRDKALTRYLRPDGAKGSRQERVYSINYFISEKLEQAERLQNFSRELGETTRPLSRYIQASRLLIKTVYYSLPLAAVIAAHEVVEQPEASSASINARYKNKESEPLWASINIIERVRRLRDLNSFVDTRERIVAPALVLDPEKLEHMYVSSALQSLAWRLYQRGRDFKDLIEQGMSLNELERLLRYLFPHTRILAERELNSIKGGCIKKHSKASGVGKTPKCLLDERNIYEGDSWPVSGSCTKDISIDERNLIAHGGFEKNVTQLLIKANGESMLRYIPECWSRIKHVIINKL